MTLMYVKLNANHQPDSFPYTLAQLRNDNPSVSFPADITDETLASYAVHPVTVAAAPAFDPRTQEINQSLERRNGVWTQVWTVENRLEAEASENIRGLRNKRLAETDYTQLADAPGDTAAWASYREELRNIPAQDGFPFTVTWPTEPS